MKSRVKEKHGFSAGKVGLEKKTYKAWARMLDRCYNPNRHNYHRYGGRGIRVCKQWRHSFIVFLSEMGISPAGTSLGRINNNKNYSAKNCRWETKKQQTRNTSANRFLVFKGKRATIAE